MADITNLKKLDIHVLPHDTYRTLQNNELIEDDSFYLITDDAEIYTDEAESGDYAGVKYKIVIQDGEPFLEVIDA